ASAVERLEQLEFVVVQQALRLPEFCSHPAQSGHLHDDRAPGPQRRDHALESQVRDLLDSSGAHKLGRELRVEWNPRLKTCAGRADYRHKVISLNPRLFEHPTEV